MAQSRSPLPRVRVRLLAAMIAGCFVHSALAMPTGAQIAAGTAAMTQAGNVLTINNSANAVLNWQSFNIAAAEAVRFNQPSAASSVLNRVTGADPSSILGQLSSNGRVWLVNPAGILVGAGARIDTAGFVASTLSLRNEDFLAGKLTFGGNANAGSVVNQGAITTPGGGSVYLIAPDVRNEGLITTPGGETLLAAGQTVQLLDTATPGVKVEITGTTGNATNLGSIVAEAGRIGMAGVLVKNSGALNASSVVSEGGRIFLKASQDAYVDKDAKLTATGSKGGDLAVLGQRVAVTDSAVLNASGTNGGGSVLVGGDYQGKNANVRNAAITYFGPKATLKADATTAGNGGKVIVWADDTTRAYGSISARGGDEGGDGGLVETSGKQYLIAGGRVDASAPHGKAGRWLLDPNNITIVNGAAGAPTNMAEAPAGVFATTNDDAQITNGTITTALNAGTSVSLATASLGTNAQSGDITISAPIVTTTATGHVSLSMTATGALYVNDVITNSGTNQLNVSLTGNNITFTAAGDIAAGTGTVNLASTGVNALTSIVSGTALSGADINIKTDNLSLVGTLNATNAATITRYNNGNELQLGGAAGDSNGFLVVTSTELANITAGTYRFGDITSTGGLRIAGAVSMPASKTLSLLTSNVGGSQIAQDAGATITATNLYAEGTAVTLTLANVITNLAGRSKGQDFNFTNAAPLNIATVDGHNGIDASGNLILTSTGAANHITQSAAIIAPGTTSLTANAASDITLTNASNNFTGAVSVTGGNVVALTDVNNLVMGTTTQAGAITLTSGGALSGGSLAGTSLTATAANGISLTGGGTGPTTVSLTNTTSGNVSYTSSLANGTYTLTAAGANNTPGGSFTVNETVGKLSVGTDDILTKDGAVSLKTQMADGLLTIGAGALVNTKNGTTTGGTVTYVADQMALESGATTANLLVLEPNDAVNTNITLGSTAADSATTLGINLTEWGTFSANTVRIGSATSGALNVSGPIGGSFALGLVSGGAITQAAGATIATPSLRLSGASVNMPEANGVGVISGTASSGDFIYRSMNKLTLSAVDGIAGINAGAGKVHLISDLTDAAATVAAGVPATGGVNQGSGAYVIAAGLRLDSKGSVYLMETGNDVADIAADLYLTAAGDGTFAYKDINALTVGTVLGQSGIKTNNKSVTLNADGLLTIDGNAASNIGIGAGTGDMFLQGASVQLGATGGNGTKIAGGRIKIKATQPSTGTISTPATGLATAITGTHVGFGADVFSFAGSAPGITASDSIFYGTKSDNGTLLTSTLSGPTNSAPFLIIGNEVTGDLDTTGSITVDSAINHSGTVVLATGAGVTQSQPITATALGVIAGGAVTLTAANSVDALAGVAGGNFSFTNNKALTVASLSGGDPVHTLTGVSAPAGGVTLTTTAGNITLNQLVSAQNTVTLDAGAAIVDGNGSQSNVQALGLVALATAGIGHGDSLETQVSYLEAVNTGTNDILVNNTGALGMQSGASNSGGNIVIDNVGAVSSGEVAITSTSGNVILTAHSPLTIGAGGVSAGGSIVLTAGSAGSSSSADIITINGPVSAGSITLAGHATAGTNVPSGGHVSSQLYSAPPPPPPEPTLADCTANPTAAGCTAVLPPLATCTTAPATPGCSVVLPSLDSCTTNPTAAGCTAVLPPLATCTTAPATPGCTAVLPPLASCTSNPTVAGCTAVLPPLATCTTAPATPGCNVVLPSLDSCTTNPTATGCTAVLPPLATCTTAPTTPGCTAVLPPLASCTSNPTAAGCTAVLPPLATCTTAPATPGCSVVLPSLASCTTNPTAAGCTSVLPPLATCTTAPTMPGCSAVLPSVDACVANPAATGCSTVLPPLATCSTAPTTPGCSVVLPPLDTCATNPALQGCAAVLPTVASCSTNPAQTGCAAVLPPVTATTASIKEVVAVTTAVTNTTTETTPVATPAPPPPPVTTTAASTMLLLSGNQTIGGTEGTFGGSSSVGTASSFSTSSASAGSTAGSAAGSAEPAPSGNGQTAGRSDADKPAQAEDKKDDKTDDKKKDEAPAKKQQDKPAAKKAALCS